MELANPHRKAYLQGCRGTHGHDGKPVRVLTCSLAPRSTAAKTLVEGLPCGSEHPSNYSGCRFRVSGPTYDALWLIRYECFSPQDGDSGVRAPTSPSFTREPEQPQWHARLCKKQTYEG